MHAWFHKGLRGRMFLKPRLLASDVAGCFGAPQKTVTAPVASDCVVR